MLSWLRYRLGFSYDLVTAAEFRFGAFGELALADLEHALYAND